METPPTQLGGLRRSQMLFNYIMLKSLIKLHAKTEIVYIFVNQIIQQFTIINLCTYYNRMLETVFCMGCAHRFHPQILFLYSARMHGNKAKRCCICFDPSHWLTSYFSDI